MRQSDQAWYRELELSERKSYHVYSETKHCVMIGLIESPMTLTQKWMHVNKRAPMNSTETASRVSVITTAFLVDQNTIYLFPAGLPMRDWQEPQKEPHTWTVHLGLPFGFCQGPKAEFAKLLRSDSKFNSQLVFQYWACSSSRGIRWLSTNIATRMGSLHVLLL